MGLVGNDLFKCIQEDFDNVGYTYGYITKCTRAENHLDKDHDTDTRCISENSVAGPTDVYLLKKVRCHNRQLHKCTTLKGGVRRLNKSPYILYGFSLFDKIKVDKKTGLSAEEKIMDIFLS